MVLIWYLGDDGGGDGSGEALRLELGNAPRPLLEAVCARLGISDRQARNRDGFGIE